MDVGVTVVAVGADLKHRRYVHVALEGSGHNTDPVVREVDVLQPRCEAVVVPILHPQTTAEIRAVLEGPLLTGEVGGGSRHERRIERALAARNHPYKEDRASEAGKEDKDVNHGITTHRDHPKP